MTTTAPLDALVIRRATRDDLEAIVRLLADDPLGATRETPGFPLLEAYVAAFAAIDADPHQELVVADLGARRTIALLQLTVLPGLTHRGTWRAQIEGVRVASDLRSRGIGRWLFEWAIARARERGCRMVQLMSDKRRPEAIRFYEGLGFVPSHEGLKLHLA
jgi:GNAT superfamily N-acetyltransferase